jgi:hypothetical protein
MRNNLRSWCYFLFLYFKLRETMLFQNLTPEVSGLYFTPLPMAVPRCQKTLTGRGFSLYMLVIWQLGINCWLCDTKGQTWYVFQLLYFWRCHLNKLSLRRVNENVLRMSDGTSPQYNTAWYFTYVDQHDLQYDILFDSRDLFSGTSTISVSFVLFYCGCPFERLTKWLTLGFQDCCFTW